MRLAQPNHQLSAEDTIPMFVGALQLYFSEIEEARAICERFEKTSAVHDRGKALQVYRLFARDTDVAQFFHRSAEKLPQWKKAIGWKCNGKDWAKLQNSVEARTMRNPKLSVILTKGIEWEGHPILIHAYKFEPDPVMKIELVVPESPQSISELPIKKMASVLRCHELLVPDNVANALPPYERHETKLLTISEYLHRNSPRGLHALPPISSAPLTSLGST